jgi:hypothetical protein
VLAFWCLLRLGEIRPGRDAHAILRRDVSAGKVGSADAIVIVVRSAKWKRTPRTVVLPAVGGPLCPVAAWRRLERRQASQEEPAFAAAEGQEPTGPLLKRVLAAAMRSVGAPCARISAHSLRVGGATALYHAGMPESALKKHGRWQDGRSASTFMMYIHALPSEAWCAESWRAARAIARALGPGRPAAASGDGAESTETASIPSHRQ